MENGDTYFQTLYHCQSSAQEGELNCLLCCCSAAGRIRICFGDSCIWKRWKISFHRGSHFPSRITTIIPWCCAVCIIFLHVSRWVYPICFEFLIYFQCWLSTEGEYLTCNKVSHQPAKSVWSNSSCLAEIREHSGTHSRNWSWSP